MTAPGIDLAWRDISTIVYVVDMLVSLPDAEALHKVNSCKADRITYSN
jgi:hypothetical protein